MSGVIHVITSLERGGAQRNTLETVARLHHPARPQLLISGAAGALDDEAAARLGVRFRRVPSLQNAFGVGDFAAIADLHQVLRREAERLRGNVVVHTHSSKAGVIGRLAAHGLPGVVVVHTVHGFGLDALGPKRSWLVEAAERAVAPLADRYVFVCEADRLRAVALGLIGEDGGTLIRSGIDAERFALVREKRGAARAALGVAEGQRLVVTLANCKPQKDPLFHVDIYTALVARDPTVRCLFVGDGPLREEATRRVEARGLSARVSFQSAVFDVSDHLAAADVFLLASAWEGLPRSVLEATAAGLPCVVRDAGWAGDLAFARSITALPKDASADEFAQAIVKKHKAPPKKLPAEFTQRGMLAGLMRLYDELCGPIFTDEERGRLMRQRRRGR